MDSHIFYLVPPAKLDFQFLGLSFQERRDRLRELLRAHGAEWAALRMRGANFLAAVEELDRLLGAREELTNAAFENSPKQMLPVGSHGKYDPLFGYYEPDRVAMFNERLRAIPASAIEDWENAPNGEFVGQVVYAFRSSFAEASGRKAAVAIDHG